MNINNKALNSYRISSVAGSAKQSQIREIFNINNNKIDLHQNNTNRIIYNNKVFFNYEENDYKEKLSVMVKNIINSNNDGNIQYEKNKENLKKSFSLNTIENLETARGKRKKSEIGGSSNELLVFQQIFIPCINCNNLISFEDVEKHSSKCTTVKEDVIKNESSTYSFHILDYKIKKLCTHINEISKKITGLEEVNLNAINIMLDQVINHQTIDYKTIVSLKKILTNIKERIRDHKGSISTLILLERSKVMITQKIKILNEDLKNQYKTSTENTIKKGNIKDKIIDEIEINKIVKKNSIPKNERESTFNNTMKSNDKFSIKSLNNSKIKSSMSHSPPNFNITKKNGSFETSKEENFSIKNQHVDINSEIEQLAFKTEFSEGTSNNSSLEASLACELRNTISRFNSDKIDSLNNDRIDSLNNDNNQSSNRLEIFYKTQNRQANYRNFVKLFLKTKFEKIDIDHPGQKINQNMVWHEVIKEKIPLEKWKDFILNELKDYKKYNEIIIKNGRKYEMLDQIDEEN